MAGKKKRGKPVRKRRWHKDDYDTLSRETRTRREDAPDSAPPEAGPESFEDIQPNGLVISPYGVLAFVLHDGEEHLCRVDDRLTDGTRSILAPGDEVLVERVEDAPFVRAVNHRRTKLSRPAIRGNREQTVAANIDLLVIVASLTKPRFKPGVIDRYLVAAQVGGVQTVVCLSKMDLVDVEPPAVAAYAELDVPVIRTSTVTGQGIGELHDAVRGKLTVFAGQSGVGKSSLINALAPHFEIETQTVSSMTEKGRHTTTTSRLYTLDDGTRIIDTPGIKQLGLWDVDKETLDYYFPEIAEYAGQCRFRNCTHTHEPGCAVSGALEAGEISPQRYRSYVHIRESLD